MTTTTPNAPKAAAPAVAEAAEEAKRVARHLFELSDVAEDMVHLSRAIDRLGDLAAAPQQVAAWMPISTAPKDGTWILLAGPDHTGAQRMVCRWTNFMEWESADDGYGAYIRPTHWQPLPAPPSQASATGEV